MYLHDVNGARDTNEHVLKQIYYVESCNATIKCRLTGALMYKNDTTPDFKEALRERNYFFHLFAFELFFFRTTIIN